MIGVIDLGNSRRYLRKGGAERIVHLTDVARVASRFLSQIGF